MYTNKRNRTTEFIPAIAALQLFLLKTLGHVRYACPKGNLSTFSGILQPPLHSCSRLLRFAGRNRWTPLKHAPSRSLAVFYQPPLLSATLLNVLTFQHGCCPWLSVSDAGTQSSRSFYKEWIRDVSEYPLVPHLCLRPREAKGGSRAAIP